MRRKKTTKALLPFVPCSGCAGGWRIVIRNGHTFAIHCLCFLRWKRGGPLTETSTADCKMASAGE